MVKIAIIGAGGRMGKNLVTAIQDNPAATLSGALESAQFPFLGADAGVHAGLAPAGIVFTDSLADAIAGADAVIDFSFREAFAGNLAAVLAAGKAFIVGTTGLTADDQALIDTAAKKIAIIHSSNYSFGIAVLKNLVRQTAAILGNSFDIEITEVHHRHKKDSPSGTALTLAEAAAAGRGLDPAKAFCYGREGIVGERPTDQIALHAIRGGDVVGEHTVTYYGDAERITLGHVATSRMTLAHGAVRAAIWIAGRPAGRYGIDDLMAD